MKIDLTQIDAEQFMVHPHDVNGEILYLVQPQHIACKWRQDNKHLRSSVWTQAGELVSAGFPKFTNFGENPEHFPVPTNLKKAYITNKLDGSLLIVSKYKGNFILRTRGTVDAGKFDNGYELEIFKEKYLDILDNSFSTKLDTWPTSYLFEWLTASIDHTIVLKYEDVPRWVLVGAVHHEDYALYQQDILNEFAKYKGFERPEMFEFNTVDELIDNVAKWTDKEGIVLYTNKGQTLHKIKSDSYKKKHAFKSDATLENTLELFFTFGKPSYADFISKINEVYDWECAEMVRGHVSNICDAYKDVCKIIEGMQRFVDLTLKPISTRKDQAVHVIASYSTSNRASMVFTLLDNKKLSDDQIKKLFWQILKK